MRFVYVGNVRGTGNNTYCPACSRPIIVRQGFAVSEYHLQDGACAYCGQPIRRLVAGEPRDSQERRHVERQISDGGI